MNTEMNELIHEWKNELIYEYVMKNELINELNEWIDELNEWIYEWIIK